MIEISSILEEIVEELKLRFAEPISIISAMDTGVSFICSARLDTKFALVIAPMMGLRDKNLVGLAVVKFGYAKKDVTFSFTDPDLIDRIEKRIRSWLDHHCLKTDWGPSRSPNFRYSGDRFGDLLKDESD